ncbi:cysteine desulfurase [Candidatus Woesearchaeota archaeon]|nr:cysteine desulfurase [Candidatus Woesearchaeota archaeon]
MEIYLDNAAGTKIDNEVLNKINETYKQFYGNPSSLHSLGEKSLDYLNLQKEKISKILNCKSSELIFTSTGTESINLAIKGFINNQKKHIITSAIEHPAVLESCKFLENFGFKTSILSVNNEGLIDLEKLKSAITKDTALVSIQYANNEIGTIQDIKEISKICKDHNVLFHTDACQVVGYEDINVKNLNIDLMSLNGNKIYGPHIGLLFVKEGIKLEPLIHGGGQQKGLRSGTEDLPLIAGFALALEKAGESKNQEVNKLTRLRDKLVKDLLKIDGTYLIGPKNRLCNNASIVFKDLSSDSLILSLSDHKFYVSSGAACASRTKKPSHVLNAIKLNKKDIESSIRFTLSKYTTEKEIEKAIEIIQKVVNNLRK